MEKQPVWNIPLGSDLALVYAPYHKISTLVNRAAMKVLRRCLESPSENIPAGMEWIGKLREPAEIPGGKRGEPDPLYLGLIPTRACTMRCAYCDFAGDSVFPLMSLELIRNAVDGYADLLRKNGAADWQMHFFGGEPFAAYKEAVFAVNYARRKAAEMNIPTHFEVTTNGFYAEEKARWIASNFDTVVLSFDGFPEVQNRHRPAPGGKDSFRIVCRNADIFARGDCELIIRSCVSAENAEFLAEWTAFIAERFFPSAVVLEPMIESDLSRRNGLLPPEPDLFMQNWIRARRILQQQGIPLIYSSGEITELKTSLCPMGQDALIVTPDGLVGGCWQLAENRRMGGIDLGFGKVFADGLHLDMKALDHQRNLSAENRERCRSCFGYAHCAGGCLLNRGNQRNFCRMTRALTLWQLLEQLGYGIFADTLISDRTYIDWLAKQTDFSLLMVDFSDLPDHPLTSGMNLEKAENSFDFSVLNLPPLTADARYGWVRDGSRIICMDPDKDFVKVLKDDEALRFQLENSGMSAPEIDTVWNELRIEID